MFNCSVTLVSDVNYFLVMSGRLSNMCRGSTMAILLPANVQWSQFRSAAQLNSFKLSHTVYLNNQCIRCGLRRRSVYHPSVTRNLHSTPKCLVVRSGSKYSSNGEEPSSKVEKTVNAMKDKIKESESKSAAVSDKDKAVVKTVAKKTLWVRVKDECKHYYNGFKLLFIDTYIASKLLWKYVFTSQTLTRREHKQVKKKTLYY